jgi:hypothetical protein
MGNNISKFSFGLDFCNITRDKKSKNIYPNRDIPTPEPVPGRAHIDV